MVFSNAGILNVSNNATPWEGAYLAQCFGPVTFFLISHVAANTLQPITITANLDDGPSYFYINGVQQSAWGNPTIYDVPSGAFALSFIACSSNGPSIGAYIGNAFITANNLTVNLDRTFHRNGK